MTQNKMAQSGTGRFQEKRKEPARNQKGKDYGESTRYCSATESER
jgi:hypothetical protein